MRSEAPGRLRSRPAAGDAADATWDALAGTHCPSSLVWTCWSSSTGCGAGLALGLAGSPGRCVLLDAVHVTPGRARMRRNAPVGLLGRLGATDAPHAPRRAPGVHRGQGGLEAVECLGARQRGPGTGLAAPRWALRAGPTLGQPVGHVELVLVCGRPGSKPRARGPPRSAVVAQTPTPSQERRTRLSTLPSLRT